MQVDSTYFVGEILIPNLTGTDLVSTGNVAEVTRFITKYEPEYLTHVLGADLYAAFEAGLLVTPTVEQRWKDLQAKIRIYNSSAHVSPVADYVYYFIELDRTTSTGQMGQVKVKNENGETVYNTAKMLKAYNNAVRKGQEILDWVIENIEDYPEFDQAHQYELITLNNFGI